MAAAAPSTCLAASWLMVRITNIPNPTPAATIWFGLSDDAAMPGRSQHRTQYVLIFWRDAIFVPDPFAYHGCFTNFRLLLKRMSCFVVARFLCDFLRVTPMRALDSSSNAGGVL